MAKTSPTVARPATPRRCPSRQYNRAPQTEPPAQAARHARQHGDRGFPHAFHH